MDDVSSLSDVLPPVRPIRELGLKDDIFNLEELILGLRGCTFCSQEVETSDHLLLACVYSREVWCRVLFALRLPIQAPGSDARLVQWWLRTRMQLGGELREGFDSLVLLVT